MDEWQDNPSCSGEGGFTPLYNAPVRTQSVQKSPRPAISVQTVATSPGAPSGAASKADEDVLEKDGDSIMNVAANFVDGKSEYSPVRQNIIQTMIQTPLCLIGKVHPTMKPRSPLLKACMSSRNWCSKTSSRYWTSAS